LDAFYATADDVKKRQEPKKAGPGQHISIATNYGIVGSQQNAIQHQTFNQAALEQEIERRGEDVEELRALVRHVASLERQEVIPKGELAQYSALLQKHSWITGPLMGALLAWLAHVV